MLLALAGLARLPALLAHLTLAALLTGLPGLLVLISLLALLTRLILLTGLILLLLALVLPSAILVLVHRFSPSASRRGTRLQDTNGQE